MPKPAQRRRLISLLLVAVLGMTVGLIPGASYASHNTHVLITDVYYDTAVTNEPDEALRLQNPTASTVDISGWKVCENGGVCATFPAGASLAAGASIWLARQAVDFTKEWTFKPTYEMIETDATVPNTSGGSPVLSNTGEAIYLKNSAGTIIDMVVYGTGTPAVGDPWSGAAVPGVSQGQLLHRAFDESLLDAAGTIHYLADTDTAADWKQGSEWMTTRTFRRGQAFLGLPTWTVTGNLTTYTTPDSSYAVLSGLVDGATSKIDIMIYEFASYQLYQKVANARARGVAVRIYMEGNPVGGLTDQSKWIAKDLTNKGAQVAFINSNTGYQRYNFTHAKFGIIDSTKVFVQSENAKQTGTPVDPSYGNRGWGVLIQDSNVVNYFQNIFNTDWNTASPDLFVCTTGTDMCSPTGGFVPDQTIPTGTYPHPYNSQAFNETYTITPVITPDHALLKSRALRQAFASATKEILAEQMYMYKYWGGSTCNETDCPDLWLQDLIDAARRGVRVRITLGAGFLDPTSPTDNTYTVQMINNIAATEGLDMEARLENLSVNGLNYIHNKGFIIDGQKVLVSSINGSQNSSAENREAALLIQNANVADFYRDVWHWNWYQGKNDAGVAQPIKNPVISEVMYDPPGTESLQEWVEIYNPTGAAISLTGWKLQNSGGTWSFPAGTSLAAGATMTIARDSAGFQGLYGFAPNLSGLTLSLGNTADYVLLVDAKGNTISKVAWGNAKPNWSLSTQQNTTLERCPATQDRFTTLDWRTGATPSPGSLPTACGGGGGGGGGSGHLVLSEVYYDTPGTDSVEEWVEIYNGTGASVNIGGWSLADNAGTWTIPANTTIANGQYLVVARDTAGFQALYGFAPDVTGMTLSLGNTGDVVRLKNSAGTEVDMVAFENFVAGWSIAANTGESIHRCPVTGDTDSVSDWVVKVTETPKSGC